MMGVEVKSKTSITINVSYTTSDVYLHSKRENILHMCLITSENQCLVAVN